MKKLNRKNTGLAEKYPIKAVQFGEGNFLRAFLDYSFEILNNELDFNAGIAVVQPIKEGLVNKLKDQDGLYHLFMRGIKNGKEIQEKILIKTIAAGVNPYIDFDSYIKLAIEADLQFIFSNTTEAGIAYKSTDMPNMCPPDSFPAKLTVFLYERFQYFKGSPLKGLTIIPCELINYNADSLKEIILKYIDEWNLGIDFKNWILKHNSFHNSLVDRIVPGYPKENIEHYKKQLNYEDELIVTAEPFFLWVIEGDDELKNRLPFHKTNLNVKVVENMQPYRTRKVRILNGAHTAMVPFSLLFGNETVKETVDDGFTGSFIRNAIFEEIIHTLEMDKEELQQFANEVLDRFRNPFIKHMLSSIALNSISKFKVRVLPSLLKYVENHQKLPVHLTFSLACLIRFYKGDWKGKDLPLNDSPDNIEAFKEIWKSDNYDKISRNSLKRTDFWGSDLTKINHLTNAISLALKEIDINGIEKGFRNFSKQI